MEDDRRVRLVRLHTDLLSEWLRGNGNPIAITTAPPDLRVVGLRQAMIGPGEWLLVVWSASFTPIDDPYEIPFIEIEYSH
jgi:hypothetical protein